MSVEGVAVALGSLALVVNVVVLVRGRRMDRQLDRLEARYGK